MKPRKPLKRGAPPKRGKPPRRKTRLKSGRHPLVRALGKRIRSKGKPRFKQGRDPQYLEWIRGLPCATTGTVNPGMHSGAIEAAHVRTRGAGGGDFGNTIPLCAAHHKLQHWQGIRTFAANHWVGGCDAVDELRRIAAEVYPSIYQKSLDLGWTPDAR